MGVMGAGKTTVGRLLASRLGFSFLDADDLHPPANLARLAAGVPLTADDRAGWIAAVIDAMHDRTVIACSALTHDIRQRLRAAREGVTFVYLRVPPDVVRERLAARTGHFAAPSLLDSQYETLEEPHDAIVVDATLPPEEIVDEIRRRQ